MAGVSITMRVSGVKELQSKLAVPLQGYIKSASYNSMYEIGSRLEKYPPQTKANDPSMPRWYERFWGSRWRRRDGSEGGRHTSERLFFQWRLEHSGAMGARLINRASYAGWVHGDKQTKVMKRIGWKTYKDVMTAGMRREIDSILQHTVQWWIDGRSAPPTK